MQRVTAEFRSYGSPEESLGDYVKLLKSSPRYSAALGTGDDAAAFAHALQKGGYATDPDYATKLVAVAARLKSQPALPT
jgi:flagellar protein FlgJ